MTYSIHLLRHLRATIGYNLNRQRQRQRLRMAKLARLSGVSAERIDLFELGKSAITLDELFKLACALDISVMDLLEADCQSAGFPIPV